MTENMKKFLEVLSSHEELRDRAAAVRSREEVMELAKELGMTLKEEDFPDEIGGEMSEEELAAVAGGGMKVCPIIGFGMSGCMCIVYGAHEDATCLGVGWEGFGKSE